MDRNRVEDIFNETQVLLTGHFVLTSGKHAGKYMQCAKILQYPKYAQELTSDLAKNFGGQKIDVVIGPATGGIIIAYELARQLDALNMFAERENGKMTLRRGFGIKPGQRVVIAEDVITTGGSVMEVVELVKAMGGEIAGVCVFVDRSKGVDFSAPLYSVYKADIESYEADDCLLCKQGLPIEKPGSRSLK